MVLSILAIVLVFGLIVFVHELGHMLAAKACGVVVPDFALGLGPTLVSRRWGETRYHLCAVPIGGFCRVAGMEGDAADAPGLKEDGRSYPLHATWQGISGWQKAFILVAGALMNLVLALVVMLGVGLIGFPANAVMIGSVEPDSPAAEAGLKPNDLILELDGQPVSRSSEFMSIIRGHRDRPLELLIQRGREQLTLAATPRVIEGFNADHASLGVGLTDLPHATTTVSLALPKMAGYKHGIRVGDLITHVDGVQISSGIQLFTSLPLADSELNAIDADRNPLGPDDGPPIELTVIRGGSELQVSLPADTTAWSIGIDFKPQLERLPLGESLLRSLSDARNMALLVVLNMRVLFTPQGVKSVSGPVGIMSLIGQSAHSGWYSLLQIVILLNVFIGLFNLLPVPALDGGRLVFVMLGGIGIRVAPQREALVHLVGMIMLLGLILVVTFSDILAFF